MIKEKDSTKINRAGSAQMKEKEKAEKVITDILKEASSFAKNIDEAKNLDQRYDID